jgi:hypothetical protein
MADMAGSYTGSPWTGWLQVTYYTHTHNTGRVGISFFQLVGSATVDIHAAGSWCVPTQIRLDGSMLWLKPRGRKIRCKTNAAGLNFAHRAL